MLVKSLSVDCVKFRKDLRLATPHHLCKVPMFKLCHGQRSNLFLLWVPNCKGPHKDYSEDQEDESESMKLKA